MKAIRSRRANGNFAAHWLRDGERTLCGLRVAALAVEGEPHEYERLPSTEACLGCVRNADGWTPRERPSSELKIVLEPSMGTIRKTGPLSHGTRARRGRRLP
jgi:hypothetical protein